MKAKVIKTKAGIKRAINDFLEDHKKFRNSYFWVSLAYRNQRENMEFDRLFTFVFREKQYEVRQSVTVSRANVYYSSGIRVDGAKKDVRVLKKVLKEL